MQAHPQEAQLGLQAVLEVQQQARQQAVLEEHEARTPSVPLPRLQAVLEEQQPPTPRVALPRFRELLQVHSIHHLRSSALPRLPRGMPPQQVPHQLRIREEVVSPMVDAGILIPHQQDPIQARLLKYQI